MGDHRAVVATGTENRSAAAYHEFKADRIVAERNFGGDMVRAVLHAVDPNVPVTFVNASRGNFSELSIASLL